MERKRLITGVACRILQTNVLLILAILTAGCASNLNMTYKSDPPFASFYAGDKKIVDAPVTIEFPVSDEDKKRGYMMLLGASVRWVSGASVTVSTVRADLKNGLSQEFTFKRPDNYPGREIDVAHAREVAKMGLMLRQVQAQERIADHYQNQEIIDSLNQLNKTLTPPTPVIPLPRPPTNCTSTVVGNTVRTTCY